MATDLLGKILDIDKAISDKEKENVELQKKRKESEAEINSFDNLIIQNETSISDLQERKYLFAREQYGDAERRNELVDVGLNSEDNELIYSALIAKGSNNFADKRAIDALVKLDEASRSIKNVSGINASMEIGRECPDEKEDLDENRGNIVSKPIRNEQMEGLGTMISIDTSNRQTRDKKVFISHASKDISAVKCIVDLLELVGFNENNMFCSSIEPYGIPTDEDIYEYLKKQFNEFDLHVIFVLSKNYYDSVACLNEMGAAWVLSCSKTVMLLPGFDFHNIEGAINPRKIAIQFKDGLSDTEAYNLKSRIDNFVAAMAKLSDESKTKPFLREEKRDGFIKAMNSYIGS